MNKITNLLGDQAAFYLEHTCKTIDKALIHLTPDLISVHWPVFKPCWDTDDSQIQDMYPFFR